MKISWPKGMERWKAVLDRYRYALLVIAAGVLLLLLPTGESRPPAEEERADGEVFFQLEELEEKLARTLSGIHGAGETEVMLTLKSGQPGRSWPRTLRAGGGGAQRLHRDPGAWLRAVRRWSRSRPWPPSSGGRWVVCAGGDDPGVRLQVIRRCPP